MYNYSLFLNASYNTFFLFFLLPDFDDLWCSVVNTHFITEVKQQLATLVLASVMLSSRPGMGCI